MSSSLRRSIAFLLLVALLPLSSLTLAACGDDQKASKTEIAVRLGLAYGSFKRYVATPAREGAFKAGAPKRKRSIAKAAAGTAFSVRMLQKAIEEAKQDPNLASLVTKITASAATIGALSSVLQGGNIDTSAITSGLGSLDGLFGAAKAFDINAKEESVGVKELAGF